MSRTEVKSEIFAFLTSSPGDADAAGPWTTL